MRRGDDVLDAIGGSHTAHGNGNFPGLGAVVYPGDDVAMDIEHCLFTVTKFCGNIRGKFCGKWRNREGPPNVNYALSRSFFRARPFSRPLGDLPQGFAHPALKHRAIGSRPSGAACFSGRHWIRLSPCSKATRPRRNKYYRQP